MMFALCLKIPTIFLEMIICWTTDLPTFSVLPFLLISYQSVVTSWRGILTDVKYIEKWQSIPVALVFCIHHYSSHTTLCPALYILGIDYAIECSWSAIDWSKWNSSSPTFLLVLNLKLLKLGHSTTLRTSVWQTDFWLVQKEQFPSG